MKTTFLITLSLLFNTIIAQEIIPFDTINWKTKPENIVEFQGRTCLSGKAEFKDISFINGTIEFDVWTNGSRSYPGIHFRVQPNGNKEHLYVRPHISGLDDAAQYAPNYGKFSCWQLYHGKGYTSKIDIEQNQWVHFKVEIIDNKAKFYWDGSTTPTLDIDLVQEIAEGYLELNTVNKNTYFSNFKFHKEEYIGNYEKPLLYRDAVSEWEISKLINEDKFNIDEYPEYEIFKADWEKVESDINGMLNISKYRTTKDKKNCVYARRIIHSKTNETVKMAFGYSDDVKVFLNKKLLYSGSYGYHSRNTSFSGKIGLNDTLFLDLQKGVNELFIITKDNFGGWGLFFKADKN